MEKEKLTEQIGLKVSEEMALAVHRLAAIEGKSSAELLRFLIDQYLEKKHQDFMVLKRVFDGKGNLDNQDNRAGK